MRPNWLPEGSGSSSNSDAVKQLDKASEMLRRAIVQVDMGLLAMLFFVLLMVSLMVMASCGQGTFYDVCERPNKPVPAESRPADSTGSGDNCLDSTAPQKPQK